MENLNKKNIYFVVVAICLLSAGVFILSKNKNEKIEISANQVLDGKAVNKTINQILVDSGVFNQNIYSPDKDIVELEEARGKKFEIPDAYEIAIETAYEAKGATSSYFIKTLRQITPETAKNDSDMPEKPLVIAVTSNGDNIVNLFAISRFSLLEGSMCWGDFDKNKVVKALETKDINKDLVPEVLIHTFKCYTADSENGLVTLYFDKEKEVFSVADKIFSKTWKEDFEIAEINDNFYILETVSGSGNCRVCPTPYLVRIYKFTGDYFFYIGSVGVEKEFEEGQSAIDYALPKIEKKIKTGDVFTL